MLIYTKGPIGYETAYKLYKDNVVQIKKQFPLFFIKRFLKIQQNIEDFDIEKYAGDVYIMEMHKGGLFGCLWELCENISCGCEIDLEKIPLQQETVEILEFFKESPYEVSSKGSYVIFSDKPVKDAVLIGFTDDTNDRVINCGNHKRYLTPPKRQQTDTQNRKGDLKCGKNY